MKELYISPELEILCFAPVEKLSNLGQTWDGWTRNTSGNGASTGDSYGGDHETPVTPEEGL